MPDRLTPEEARKLVEQHGGQRAAARAYGVAISTFHHWLDPEAKNARRRERYRTDPEFAERERERNRKWYDELTGLEYNRLLLRLRRNKALKRIDERRERWREEYGTELPEAPSDFPGVEDILKRLRRI